MAICTVHYNYNAIGVRSTLAAVGASAGERASEKLPRSIVGSVVGVVEIFVWAGVGDSIRGVAI